MQRNIDLTNVLVITSSITINGNGYYLSGNDARRVMRYNGPGTQLRINNITIKNGRVTDFKGAGINAEAGTLTIENSAFIDNSALGDDGDGGGIRTGTDMTIRNTTFRGNSSESDGGAIIMDPRCHWGDD